MPVRQASTHCSWVCSGTWLCTNNVDALRVDPERQQLGVAEPRALAQQPRVVLDRDRVLVDDAVEGVVVLLQRRPSAGWPQVVADVERVGRRLDARQHTGSARTWRALSQTRPPGPRRPARAAPVARSGVRRVDAGSGSPVRHLGRPAGIGSTRSRAIRRPSSSTTSKCASVELTRSPRLGSCPRWAMNQPATVSYGPSGSPIPASSREVLQVEQAVDLEGPVVGWRGGVLGRLVSVVLVVDVADELLDEVLEGHDARRCRRTRRRRRPGDGRRDASR